MDFIKLSICITLLSCLPLSLYGSEDQTIVVDKNGNQHVFSFKSYTKKNEVDHKGYTFFYESFSERRSDDKEVILILNGYDYSQPFKNLQNSLNTSTDEKPKKKLSYVDYARVDDTIKTFKNLAATSDEYKKPIVVFEVSDSTQDIKKNGANLSHAIKKINLLISNTGIQDEDGDGFPDYKLTIVANDISGLWLRSALVMENSNLGIDRIITLDTPHKGIQPSKITKIFFDLISYKSFASKQIRLNTKESNDLYSWLEKNETDDFYQNVVDPIDTTAVAFSYGENSWNITTAEYTLHGIFHHSSSNVSFSYIDRIIKKYSENFNNFVNSAIREASGGSIKTPLDIKLNAGVFANAATDFVPYHSAIMIDLPFSKGAGNGKGVFDIIDLGWFKHLVSYKTTKSRYFDHKVSLLKDYTRKDAADSYEASYDRHGFSLTKHKLVWSIINNKVPSESKIVEDASRLESEINSFIEIKTSDLLKNQDTILSVSRVKNGNIKLHEGKLLFNPNRNFYGPVSFSYVSGDNLSRTDIIQVTKSLDALDGAVISSEHILTGNNDTFAGDDGNNIISGGLGFDSIQGGKGNDVIYGDSANDSLSGGEGNDILHGGSGSDNLNGDDGNDFLIGGTGNDSLFGGDGDDRLEGDEGHDSLHGGDGDDAIIGGSGDDKLYGEAGFDRLEGGDGRDTMEGGDGDDELFGGEGSDKLFGNSGDDHLSGGKGNDYLEGGDGDNVYVFKDGDGRDTLNSDRSQNPNATHILNLTTNKDNLWFLKDGDHLRIVFVGQYDRFIVQNWFAENSTSYLDKIVVDGFEISKSGIDALYTEMAKHRRQITRYSSSVKNAMLPHIQNHWKPR